MRYIKESIVQPRYALFRACQILLKNILPDKVYLQLIYYIRFRKRLCLKNPVTFNEKLNWLKLYNRKDIYTVMADKYEAKAFVAKKIGSEYVVDNYGVYDNWEDIDFNRLPNAFVIKGTHDSGGAFICKNKSTCDFTSIKKRVKKNLCKNYFYDLREWPYKSIKPRIIVDKLLDDHTGNELRDYKFWCFNGEPHFMYCTINSITNPNSSSLYVNIFIHSSLYQG